MPVADYQKHLAAMREYARTPAGKEARKRANQAYRIRNRQKLSAHNAIAKAVLRGKLAPMSCELCGAKAEAHHPDYSRPLLVTWLCPPHHKQAHRESKV